MTGYQITESEKRFRMTKPYRLIINDDSGRDLWNWVGPFSAEQYQDAVRLQQRSPDLQEGVTVDFAELDV
jgi:hypothetical protein